MSTREERTGKRGHEDGNVRPADDRYGLHEPEEESTYVRSDTPEAAEVSGTPAPVPLDLTDQAGHHFEGEAVNDDTTTKASATRYKVGDVIKVKPAGIVTRPDGTTHIVIRGAFYLDQVGTFVVDGTKVTVE